MTNNHLTAAQIDSLLHLMHEHLRVIGHYGLQYGRITADTANSLACALQELKEIRTGR